jgi:hypothetical protein
METVYLGIVIFLFMLAVFDLLVGVSNDAVNFMNSAVGAKVAKFKTIIIVAAIGVFFGAVLSNGMMDIARHGIFHPVNFSFYEIMCILLAVMVTDVVLLDVFNTLGLPTSTTVSMVFELLGGTFIEHIQQYHICHNYSQQDTHNLIEAEIYRMKDTMTRNIHHSITQYGTKEDTDSRHNNNCFKLCDFCPHRRIHKIHGVITNAHQQIKDRQHK